MVDIQLIFEIAASLDLFWRLVKAKSLQIGRPSAGRDKRGGAYLREEDEAKRKFLFPQRDECIKSPETREQYKPDWHFMRLRSYRSMTRR